MALALLVCGSLGLLAWTLAIGGRRAVEHERQRVTAARAELAVTERKLRDRMATADAAVRTMNEHMQRDNHRTDD